MGSYPSNNPRQGEVILIGFGPGDPDLLTVKAMNALRQADIIFYDALTNEAFLQTLPAEKVYVGKRCGRHHEEQEQINALLLEAAQKGKNVIRLKGGDPMVFAHAGEEISFLERNGIKTSVIPGITTALALAAKAKISLTYRGISSSVAFINGHSSHPEAPSADTLVYYMGASHLRTIAKELIDAGRKASTPVLLAYNVSLPDEQFYHLTLGDLLQSQATYPTPLTVLIGEVILQK